MAKQRTIIGPDPNDSNKVIVSVTVDDRGTERQHSYSMLKDAAAFQAAVAKLSGDDLEKVYNLYDYALGLAERASVREAVAAESTEVTIDKVKVDLMSLPTSKLIMGINGARAMEAMTGKAAPNAFTVAARKLVEDGKATESNPSNVKESILSAK